MFTGCRIATRIFREIYIHTQWCFNTELTEFGDKHGANMRLLACEKTETGHVLETEIVEGVFHPVAEGNTDYIVTDCSIVSYQVFNYVL